MWTVVRRLLAVVGLLVAVVGCIAFATAAVGVWWVKAETNKKTDEVAARAHKAVDGADHAVGFVREVISEGNSQLTAAKKTAAAARQEPVNPLVQFVARDASKKLAGSVERADGAIVTASDTLVGAEAALKLFENDEEMKAWLGGVGAGNLVQTKGNLDQASRELKRVRSVLGVQVGSGTPPSPEQLSTVESALTQASEFTDQMSNLVTTARGRVVETKRTVDLWVLRVAIGVTIVGVVGAAGQFFMARFFWWTLRGKPA